MGRTGGAGQDAMDAAVTITVPMVPHSCLLPNRARRTWYGEKAMHARGLREATSFAAFHAGDVLFAGPVHVDAVIAWPKGRRRCDFDAAVAALKPCLDGLADAAVYADDKQVVGMTVTQEKGTDVCVTLTITEAATR